MNGFLIVMNKGEAHDCALLVFVKHPEPGSVKTRLAADIGDDKATRIYQKLLSYTESIVAQLPVETHIYYANEMPEDDLWTRSETGYKRVQQVGPDLGARMESAFADMFRAGKRRVVIVGSDCAELRSIHLLEAFRALNDNDAVIGPANDGGYYLLGLNRMIPSLFRKVEWSTQNVYKITLDRFREAKLRWYTLQVLTDIDNYEDWKKTGHRLV
jgi:rSAM/selenodomain-associated transferase 1